VRQVRVSPLSVSRDRRLRIQWGQGRGGLGYRFTVQYPYYCQDNFKILLLKIDGKVATGFIKSQTKLL
jgi:hypothetical protein